MAIGTPWVGAEVQGNVAGTNATSVTVDVSGATNGEVVWIFGALSDPCLGNITPPAGWTSFGQTAAGTSRMVIFWKVKASGDTTVTISDATNWTVACRRQFVGISWPGVDTTAPAEGLVFGLHTSPGTSYPTASSTPTAANRWAVGVFEARGSTAATPFTSDAALVSRSNVVNTATAFLSQQVADSNGAVTQAAHTYTATGQSASNGGAGLLYLIPAATPTPSGSAALSGSGTLTLTGAPATPGTVGLSGSGSLSTAGQPALPGSLSLSGSGALAPTGSPAVSGAAALAGSGTLAASAQGVVGGTASLTGAGTLTLAGQPGIPGQLSLVGAGALGLQGAPGVKDNLLLTGAGQFAAVSPASTRDLTLTAVIEPDRWGSTLEPDRWTAAIETGRWMASLDADRWTAEIEPNRWEGTVPWPEL